MNEEIITFFLGGIIVLLLCFVLYQQFIFKIEMQKKLNAIAQKLSDVLENDSDEKIMVFTSNKALMNLCGQINLLLLDRQKIKVDFKKQEIASKKMLANISHDIKTPLTVILGYLEILRLHNREDEMLQKVEAKTKQVIELINQFFSLAKLEAGDTSIEITKININELCRENILSFYELLLEKNFVVDISIPEQPYFVQGDKEAIDRILFNLISNAIRYGSDGKYMGLFIREMETYICIDIIDKGKGIEKEYVSNVFERLYTMEDSRNRNIQGNGLGLTIAKNLAIQLGGDVLLESEPNIRTSFSLKLKKYMY